MVAHACIGLVLIGLGLVWLDWIGLGFGLGLCRLASNWLAFV